MYLFEYLAFGFHVSHYFVLFVRFKYWSSEQLNRATLDFWCRDLIFGLSYLWKVETSVGSD